MKTWTLVRHGESTANAKSVLSGWQDVSLTKKGRKQAKDAGVQLASQTWDLVISSDLKRARETAEIALLERSKICGTPPQPIHFDPRFRERSLGIFQGKDKTELRENGTMHRLRQWDFEQEGVESNQRLWHRLTEGMRSYQEKRVLLFAHGGVIRLLLSWNNRHLHSDSSTMKIENASIHEIGFTIEAIDSNWVDVNYGKQR